ncbi:ABC transporter permease [Bacteroidota bacterium]
MKRKKKQPPVLAYLLLKLFANDWKNTSLIGDLEEEYFDIAADKGFTYARLWYLFHVFSSLPKLIKDSNSWGVFMFKNYFKISWRNIKKYKTFSFINISGLAIGMACCILLLLYINSELSFDIQHEKGDRIYRVCSDFKVGDIANQWSASNAVIAEALQDNYGEVESAIRVSNFRTTVTIGDEEFSERFYFMDENVFDIFTYPLIYGDLNTALSTPYSIVLTQETAEKYFGPVNPIGKTIKTSDYESLTITGVMENVPRYSTYRFNGICSFSTLYAGQDELPITLTDWRSHTMVTFVLLKKGIDYKVFSEKIKNIYYDYIRDELEATNTTHNVFLQPLRDIYLRPLGTSTSPIVYVYILSTVAVFVLLIACINFMNLSTARAVNRAKEVGMRKVLGANRGKLIKQFLIEAVFLTILAIFLAIALVYLALPEFSDFVRRDLMQDLLEMTWIIPTIFILALGVGLAAGSYPAFYLSKFLPAHVMQNRTGGASSNTKLRKSLVVLQFTLSIVLIIGTFLIMQQLDFLKGMDPGFNKEKLMIINIMDEESRDAIEILKNQFKQNPNVLNAGAASMMPLWGAPSNNKIPEGFTKASIQIMHEINVDANYFETVGIEIIEGRNFSAESTFDQRNSVIINETAVKKYNWDNPIGKTIQTFNTDYNVETYETRTVIGVVKDFYNEGLLRAVEPMFIGNHIDYPYRFGWMNGVAVKLSPDDVASTVEFIEKTWKAILPGKEIYNYFLEDTYDNQFGNIDRSRHIFSYFTFLAIFIAVLGLLGMAMFTAEKRIKEIGIRKVLGSSVSQIVYLLTRELLMPVLIASLIAYPIAYYFIDLWLQDFTLQMEIGISAFIISSGIALIISFITVAILALKAAIENPVNSLRCE